MVARTVGCACGQKKDVRVGDAFDGHSVVGCPPFPRDPPSPPNLFDYHGQELPPPTAENPTPSNGRAFCGEGTDATSWLVMVGIVLLVALAFGLGVTAGADMARSTPAACPSSPPAPQETP